MFHEVDLDQEVAGIMILEITEIHGIIEDKIDQRDLIGVEAHVVEAAEVDLENIIEVFHAASRFHQNGDVIIKIERIKWMMSIEEVVRVARRMKSGRN